ncbi:uncharacterized protein LOC123561174 isoform X2 [Mercenaria mercenaria]|uniref:uncharacterized protein LOC123561174 isoform X2 n=1 Tax=Mercenaria mercenaria TaxID=6596 RepID=UPI00234E89DA|nr:uncharacterized protein LOC123561174 isoform X2 [Mercenaria mercenaria]
MIIHVNVRKMKETLILLTITGFLFHLTTAQVLTTKCPGNDWTKYKERCYLYVGFRHSWSRAYNYCQKYGAKLVEPTGYVINDDIATNVSNFLPNSDSIWTGYYRPDNNQPSFVGQWSDGRPTSVHVAPWGDSEPDTAAGQCAFMSTQDSRWYMGDCGRVRNFVCEMDPCPAGNRNTFMCNGKCLGRAVLCNGVDDCGNNQDEQNCNTVSGGDCTVEVEGTSGQIAFPPSSGLYNPNVTCSWTMKTSPGNRIVLQFTEFETEENNDFAEIFDGCITPSTSELSVRLSGSKSGYTFISSYNFVTVRFVSDASIEYSGFQATWDTDLVCSFSQIDDYTYSNVDISDHSLELSSRQTIDECKQECEDVTPCVGFRYDTAGRKCHFLKKLPVLQMLAGSQLWIQNCYGDTTIQGAVPLLPTQLFASPSGEQLATPLYPYPYVGNFEEWYTITASANSLITLEVLTLELCCDDKIYIYDEDHDLLDSLTSVSTPRTLISTSNTVHIKMELMNHWKCRGALIEYIQGCAVSMVGSGVVSSPGYGTVKSYPDLMECSWTLYAPSAERSVTVIFDYFDLEQMDTVTVTQSNGTVSSHTGSSLHKQSFTSESYITLAMSTSSLDNSPGFLASFSPGCPVLNAEGYVLSSESFDFGDQVTVSCAEGYYFGAGYGQEISLSCESGGYWDRQAIPTCSQGKCGPAPFIDNGNIVSSDGSLGGDNTVYECYPGFTLLGSSSIRCLANNSWELPPSCVSTPCQTISSVAPNTDAVVLLGDGVNHGSVVNLTCSQQNEIIGAPLVQCQSGLWDFILEFNTSYCERIPCETPVIEHAVLSPDPEYVQGQEVNVTCIEGYNLEGDPSFICGEDNVLPACIIQDCTLEEFDHVVPVDSSAPMVYMYGDSVNVTCEYSYYLENIATTQMTVTCLSTGDWSHMPICSIMPALQEKSCGEPYQVPGSEYIPAPQSADFCYEHNCSFTFHCRDKYVRLGNSTSGGTLVTCGEEYDGLWPLGDLRCIGGQCYDPGYPASGELIGTTFEEGATVMFSCLQSGYEPLNSTGHVSEGMTCQYNTTTKQMEWIGEMPECKDTQPPVILNCGDGSIMYEAEMLVPLSVAQPYAIDNTAVKEWNVYPENTYLSRPFVYAITTTYIATDFNGNSGSCTVAVVIPDSMDCENDRSTDIQLTADRTISVANSGYVSPRSFSARLVFDPETLEVTADAAALNTIYEVEVTSFQGNTSTILDKCTLQFRFHAPTCSDWEFEVPNGMKTCTASSCNVSCNTDAHFMEEPTANSISMTCIASGWNREPPVCAQSTDGYVIYTAQYDFKYFIELGVGDKTTCEAAYRSPIQQKLRMFASAMQTQCNTGSNNPVNITLLEEKTYLEFTLATKRDSPANLTVRFEFQLVAQDETLQNAASVKDQCSNTIMSSLNTKTNIDSISTLARVVDGSYECNAGVYDLTSTQPVFEYKCQGYRLFVNIGGQRKCLNCPQGYYYDQTDCVKCPAGTYGVMTADGASCETCPNNNNNGLTGQTDASSCNFKAACPKGYFSFDGLAPCTACPKNYYSSVPYSRTCTACHGYEVTYQTGSTSSNDCHTLEEAIEYNNTVASIETGCTPNPCRNGGNCSFERLDFLCTCPTGYTGRTCESIFNGCTSQPCKNEKQCVPANDGVGFSCICGSPLSTPHEFSGEFCENDDFGCAESYCRNNGTCHNQFQSFSCKCATYSGYQNAENRNQDGVCNVQIDPCTVNPCQYGTCINNSHFYRTCDCYPGWTGIDCDTSIDDCVPNYCQNGATCVDGVNSFTCHCATGFHAPYCQFRTACAKKCERPDELFCNTCDDVNTESCMNINNDFRCQCNSGYAGRSCEISTSICKSFPCQHGGTCTANNATSFTCMCTEPWIGDHCDQLTNHCPNGDQCFNGGTCYSTLSGYRCSCLEDFIGDDCSTSYDLCARANPCAGTESICSFMNGQYDCDCQTGYSGDYCENHLPSCSDNICLNGASCSDTNDGAECTCTEGYTGSTCETDINNCSPNPCSTNQECTDGIGGYTCICAVGYRGENCDKGVGEDFDYIIAPEHLCRTEASVSMFGDGVTNIDALSISFWARYKAVHEDGVILNVFGSKSGGMLIPSTPDFQLTFFPEKLHAFNDDTSTTRRKRETKVLDYQKSIADGYWHLIVVTWSAVLGEITLYVDGQYADQTIFSRDNAVANIGFLVFGDFDPVTGTSVPESSFEGRVNRLYVVDSDLTGQVQQLYSRSHTPSVILHPERTTMRLYSVDYNSELRLNSNKCLPTDTTCKDINAGAVAPEVTSCPGDTFVVTERGENFNWTEPEFTGSIPAISNVGGSGFEFGVHGISYASIDGQGDAAICTFRLFYRDVECGSVDGSDASCLDAGQGITRCTEDCSGSQLLSGNQPIYLSCSMYGMWDEAVKYTDYIYPECSDTTDITERVTLSLTAVSNLDLCDNSILNHYRVAVRAKFDELNDQQPNNELCLSNSCIGPLLSAFSCVDNSIRVSIDFGILSSTMRYEGASVTTEELLKIAVGDFQAFDYRATNSNSNMTISPDLSTFDASFTPECAPGYMVSNGKCVLCGRGTFYDSPTKSCKRCATGSYRSDLTSLVSGCTSCSGSATTPAEGAKDQSYCITNCLPGSYYEVPNNPSLNINQGTCRSCGVGYYQNGSGKLSCKPCPLGLTTAGAGSTGASFCVTPESLTTTTEASQTTPRAGAATEESGLSVGVIVAVVLGVILGLSIIILIICFCCCKELVPCLSKKKQVVSPTVKDGYYARKYGDHNMQFVSYNLQDIREKKGKPMDRVPFVEPPLSDETGSVKTDISVHVPVFNEKMNGKIKRKSMYVSNGGQNLSVSLPRSGRTPRDPVMTSSPRELHYQNEMEEDVYVKPKQKRRRKRQRKDRSTSERRSRRHYDNEDMEPVNIHVRGPLPKALAPMPRIVSQPPADVILRPSSALEQPRVQVVPSQYEDFLDQSPTRDQHQRSGHSSRSRDKERSRSRRRPKSYDDDYEEPRHQYSGMNDDEQPPFNIRRIEVESDEDLR